MKVKENSGKDGLKLNIQKTKIMACGPITSWQINGETLEAVRDFLFLGSKITSWEIDGETVETVSDFIFLGPKSLQMVSTAMKLKDAYSLEGKL